MALLPTQFPGFLWDNILNAYVPEGALPTPSTSSSVPQTTNPSVPSGTSGSVPEQIPNLPGGAIGQWIEGLVSAAVGATQTAAHTAETAANAAQETGKAFSSVGDFLGWLKGKFTDLQWWKSVGLIWVGALLVIGGTMIWAFGGVQNAAKDAEIVAA